jgi:hypothetical protein
MIVMEISPTFMSGGENMAQEQGASQRFKQQKYTPSCNVLLSYGKSMKIIHL